MAARPDVGHNRGMYMSVETITMLVSAVSILLALAAGFGWMIHRMDSRLDDVENRLGTRIEKVADELADVENRLGARFDKVADELVEVKVAIARIEGPPRHLVPAR